jgi:outer membrane receptor protein involved in Fe transport
MSERSLKAISVLLSAGFSASLQAQAPTTTDEPEVLEEIAVTGTRISRSGFTAPTPTTTLGAEDRELRASTTVANLLNELPSIRPTAPSLTSQNTGIQAINLRGLNGTNNGSTRTLVLVDGRRFVPTTITGVVDSNVVPSALIERVEIVTGGASAAWGSDAVAGVANFIFKDRIEGFHAEGQYGLSERGDNQDTSASLAWGTGFAGNRGQLMLAGEYSALKERQTFADRDWSNRHTGFVTGQVNGVNVTRVQVDGLTMSGLTAGGVITAANGGPIAATSPLRGLQFGAGGAPQPYTYGTSVGNTTMIGGDGAWFQDTLLISAPVERKNAYGRLTFGFTDSMRGSFEASFMESSSDTPTFPLYNPNTDTTVTIQRDNGYLQTLAALAPVRAILAANPGIPSFSVGRINSELGRNFYEVTNQSTRFVAGLDGDFAESGQWKFYATHGETDYDSRISEHLIEPNWRAALDTVVENGQVICRVNSTVAANIAIVSSATYAGRGAAAGCAPANVFGAGSVTQNVRDYVTGTQSFISTYKQDAAGASMQGEPFSTWADKVSVAGGLEYRKESVDGTSDSISQLRNAAYLIGGFQYGNPKPIRGSYNVREAFLETIVPLASRQAWARSLDLNAAARRTDYSTSGQVTTWKGGLTYKPIETLLIRGTRSRDIRAPNLNELYASSTLLAFGATDYGLITNGLPTSYNSQQVTTGNLNLQPEIAATRTFGISWEPGFAAGLRTSVDYFDIQLSGGITARTAQTIVNSCYGQNGSPLNTADCALIQRDPATNRITAVNTFPINDQLQTTKGIDYELSYSRALGEWIGGTLNLRLLATEVMKLTVGSIDRAGEIGTGTSAPRWRGNLSGSYQRGAWTLFGQARYVDAGAYDNTFGATAIANNEVPSRTYLDATVQYEIQGDTVSRTQIYGRVANLLDKDPPVLANANQNAAPTNTALYDVGGRSFVVGVRMDF